MKEFLKKTFFSKIIFKLKGLVLYIKDMNFYLKNFINSKKDFKKIGYDMELEVHKLEKGMINKKIRPFGREKVKKILDLINEYDKLDIEPSFEYNLACSILEEYKKIYEKNNWIEAIEYKTVSDFINQHHKFKKLDCGASLIKFKNLENKYLINYYDFVLSRHSIRNYAKKEIPKEILDECVQTALLSPSACNRQMCKIYYVKKLDNINLIKKYAKGLSSFNLDNANYFVVTFDVSAFYFLSERNQGWLNAGLFSMNFVNALHSKGIGSCFIQFDNNFKEEKIIKENLKISKSERIAVIIVCGYYLSDDIVPTSCRKEINDIFIQS